MENRMKTAFLFPGQGSQVCGMGKDLYDRYQVCKEVFHTAEEVCEMKIRELCFYENVNLHQTKYLQPCLFSVCAAFTRAAREEGLSSHVHAGLSLGEYVALDASKVMDIQDLLLAVKLRGTLMQEAYEGESAMVAILSTEHSLIEDTLADVTGVVSIANYNTPSQVVITGEKSAIDRGMELLRQKGIKHFFPLKVSGPFHSKLMEPAKKSMEDFLQGVQVHSPLIPYISNVTGDYVREKDDVVKLLLEQMVSPVRWYQGVQKMIENGVENFVELGPGKSLTNMLLSIQSQVKKTAISSAESLQEYKKICCAV